MSQAKGDFLYSTPAILWTGVGGFVIGGILWISFPGKMIGGLGELIWVLGIVMILLALYRVISDAVRKRSLRRESSRAEPKA